MDRTVCRYTTAHLESLGYPVDSVPDKEFHYVAPMDSDEMRNFFYGGFQNIIDYIYSEPGSNIISKLTSENTPANVRSFIDNFLMKRLQSLPSQLDDDSAFEMIIPRSAQSSAELRPYLDKFKDVISAIRQPKTD